MKADLAKTWELLRPHVLPRVPVLVLVAVLGALSALSQSVVLVLFQPVWDLVLFPLEEGASSASEQAGQGADAAVRAFAAFGTWATERGLAEQARSAVLFGLVAFAMVLAIIGAASQFGCTWFARWASYRMVVDLRIRVAQHLMGLSMRYHQDRQLGDVLSRTSSDVTTTLGAINVGLKSLLQEPLFALAALAVAAYVAPLPTLLIVVLLPLSALPIRRLSSRVRKGSQRSLTSLGASVQALSQMFQGVRTVKSFGGEARELERYRQINLHYLKQSMRMVKAIAMTHSWTVFSSVAGVAVLVGALGFLEIRFDLFGGGGQMTVFFLAVGRLTNHVKHFVKALTQVQESFGASVRIQDLLDEKVDVVERKDPVPISSIGRGIRFEDVSFRYPGAERDAIAGVSIAVRPGETLALVGPSGSGKSTLIDLVARFIDPTGGRVTVDGTDLRDLRVADWVGQVALVGQTPFLFHASVAENIRYGRPGATDAEVQEAARAANIHERIAALPKGYESDVADMGARLSGGERQRITIARALLKGAPLLLLDEATSSLDSQSEAQVQRALERLMAERTVIVIAHRLATIQKADRIAVLEEGRLVEIGRHEELLARGGPYSRLHRLQRLEPEGVAPAPAAGPR